MIKDYLLPPTAQILPTVCGLYATAFCAEAKAGIKKIGRERVDIDTLIYNWNALDGVLDKSPEPFLQRDLDNDNIVDDLEKISNLRLWCNTYSLEMYNIQRLGIDTLDRSLKNNVIPILYISFKSRYLVDGVQAYSSKDVKAGTKRHIVAVRDIKDGYIELHDSNGGKFNRIYLPDYHKIIESVWTFNVRKWEKKFNHPIRKVWITQKFGENYDYYKKFNLPGHTGLDYRASINTPIYPCFNGKVKSIDFNKYEGNRVFIEAGDMVSKYTHLNTIQCKVGDNVTIDNVIALSGNTGESTTGPHLHFDIKQKGVYIDPLPLLS